jgi:hypothetical protein
MILGLQWKKQTILRIHWIGWRKTLNWKVYGFPDEYHVLFQFNEQCGTCKFWDKSTCGTARVIPWHPQIGGGRWCPKSELNMDSKLT